MRLRFNYISSNKPRVMLRCNWITAKYKTPKTELSSALPSASETVFKNRFLVSVLMRRICCFGQNLSLYDNEIRIFNSFHVPNIKQNIRSGMCFTEWEFIHIKFREIDCTAFLHVLAQNPLNNRSLE